MRAPLNVAVTDHQCCQFAKLEGIGGREELTQYDPFSIGPHAGGVRTIEVHDAARSRSFLCEIWQPLGTPIAGPSIVYSHPSAGGRRSATFLCSHLASHGYLVAAMDHSELVAKELQRQDGETPEQKAARVDGWMANRVPDIRFLVEHLLTNGIGGEPVGLVGHSFGGWTVLATPDQEPRVRAVVALAPAGNSKPKPGIIPAKLNFAWGRDVPTLILAGENDISLPLDGVYEIFDRTPATKQIAVLGGADHLHFMDNVEQMHEAVRAMSFTGELAWIPKEMKPIAGLCSGEKAHLFTRELTLAHFDTYLLGREDAREFLAGEAARELDARGVRTLFGSFPPNWQAVSPSKRHG